jgi:hypothetical protein
VEPVIAWEDTFVEWEVDAESDPDVFEAYLDDSPMGALEDESELAELGEVLRDALREDYVEASSEELEDALSSIFESMTPAESFNFAKALGQIEKGAAKALSDPAVTQFAGAALPIAGAAVGTVFGGPAGTALGSGLGSTAAKALAATRPVPRTTAAPKPVPPSPAASGSAAAAKGLVLTQQPDVLKALLALSLGEHGRKSLDGVQVGAVMNLLSTIFGQAAADADELAYASEEDWSSPPADEWAYEADLEAPSEHAEATYAALLDAENEELAEVMGEW